MAALVCLHYYWTFTSNGWSSVGVHHLPEEEMVPAGNEGSVMASRILL